MPSILSSAARMAELGFVNEVVADGQAVAHLTRYGRYRAAAAVRSIPPTRLALMVSW